MGCFITVRSSDYGGTSYRSGPPPPAYRPPPPSYAPPPHFASPGYGPVAQRPHGHYI